MPLVETVHHTAFWMYNGVPITLCRCSLTHTLFLLVHTAIQMKMALIIEVNSPWFMSLKSSVLHRNFLWKQFHIFSNYPLCSWCFQVEEDRFSGTLHQHLLIVIWWSDRFPLTDNTLLIVDHISSCLNLFWSVYYRPAMCFPALRFHSEFAVNEQHSLFAQQIFCLWRQLWVCIRGWRSENNWLLLLPLFWIVSGNRLVECGHSGLWNVVWIHVLWWFKHQVPAGYV